MKALLEHLPPEGEESFFAKAFEFPYFGTPWHYHPEFELVLVVESEGKRFVGNAVSDFSKGDLSFFGPNLPHLYKNPASYYAEGNNAKAKSIVIHFLESSIGADFLKLPQNRKLLTLFEKAEQGIDIHGDTKQKVASKMVRLIKTHGLTRLIHLLEILNILADSDELTLISSAGIKGQNLPDSERMDKIFQYVMQRFSQEISLEQISKLVCMTPTSFCRYFKERTKRTFSEFLIDFRLHHARKLLLETDKQVIEIALSCGYNNLSNFNRQFKAKYGTNPTEYRKHLILK